MRILHVPYTYFPDAAGGTEFYVRSLAHNLKKHGCISTIAAPGNSSLLSYQEDYLHIYRLPVVQSSDLAQGVPDPVFAEAFTRILGLVRPHIVHLHARTGAVSELLLFAAQAFGARTVVTYHTPTMSCMRGTMVLNGRAPCDGLLDSFRCTSCVLRSHGLGGLLAAMLALSPKVLGKTLRLIGLQRGPWLAFRMRQIVDDHIVGVNNFFSSADLLIAPSYWVANLLLANGVPPHRLRLNRQGLAHPLPKSDMFQPRAPGNPLRLGFFGRLDPTKGIDVLIQALRLIPEVNLVLSIYGVSQEGSASFAQQLYSGVQQDNRIEFLPGLASDQVLTAMHKLDLVLVPSLVMETGPLVILEAYAAGIPVVGSDHGGIAELIRSDVDGLLLPPGNPQAWALALGQLATDSERISRWRQAIQQPRTMADVAIEMANCYGELLKQSK